MYKFINRTSKEQFENLTAFSEDKLTQVETYKWIITDRFSNKWTVIYNENVDQFNIFNDAEPFWVQVAFKHNLIEILQGTLKGRKLKSERYLKKFSELAMLISCYLMFGQLKTKIK